MAGTGNLTPAQISEYEEAFNLFDKNKDNLITPSELLAALKNLGQNPTQRDVENMINEVDKTEKGSVNFEEFVDMMERKRRQTDSEDELMKVFRIFDRNADGFISADELRHVLNSLGENLSISDCTEMIKQADTNRDGLVNFNEFKSLMNGIGGV